MFRVIILTDIVLIVQYIFVFHSKNPTAVQDDFWTLFINLWACSKFLLNKTYLHTYMLTCLHANIYINIFIHIYIKLLSRY